jgi:hypothetical protein
LKELLNKMFPSRIRHFPYLSIRSNKSNRIVSRLKKLR